jgi:hypothetical protein
MELLEYLENSLYKFIDGMVKDDDINFMLLDKDKDNRDSITLLS